MSKALTLLTGINIRIVVCSERIQIQTQNSTYDLILCTLKLRTGITNICIRIILLDYLLKVVNWLERGMREVSGVKLSLFPGVVVTPVCTSIKTYQFGHNILYKSCLKINFFKT